MKRLFICGSNRKQNSFRIINDLAEKGDKLFCLSDMNVKNCLGCNSCLQNLENYCVIKDDMQAFYNEISLADKIVIVSPIYFDTITGILKNMIDRWMPLCAKETLNNKALYLITVGEQTETENEVAEKRIKDYFEYLSDSFGFKFIYLKTMTSEKDDRVELSYENYSQIISKLKDIIKN